LFFKKNNEQVWGKMARRYWNINLEEMMEAGVHFGHGTRKWNPRMAPFISAIKARRLRPAISFLMQQFRYKKAADGSVPLC